MANPNIRAETGTIIGLPFGVLLTDTSATVVLNNPALSGKLLRVNSLRAVNVDGTNAAEITLSWATEDDGGGTLHALASTITVPADAALIILSKNDGFNLREDASLVATASAGNDIYITGSYDEIS